MLVTAAGRRFVVLAMLASLAAACREPAAPAGAALAAEPTAAEPVWHPLGSWTGRGDRQTDSFDVTTGALQLRWTARETTPGAGRLKVSLHSAISGRPLQTVLEVRGPGAAEVYAADEPRVSYLVIESDGVEWTLELREAAAGSGEAR